MVNKEGSMEVGDVLERALQILEHGWTQDTYCDEYGVCPIRATWMAVGEQYTWNGGGRVVFMEALRALQQETGHANIAAWNDSPDRTYAQVRETFRRAQFVVGHQLVAA